MEIKEIKEQMESVANTIKNFRRAMVDMQWLAFMCEIAQRSLAKRLDENAAEWKQLNGWLNPGMTPEEIPAFLAWLSDSLEELASEVKTEYDDIDTFDASSHGQAVQAMTLLSSVGLLTIRRKLDAIRVGVEDAKRECGMKTKEIEMEWAVDDDDEEAK